MAYGVLYAATRAGELALTKSVAQEYGQQGVRVNALVAGSFRMPMLERVFERNSDGNPEAEAAAWFCSEAASYVAGPSMMVDGGLTAWAR